MRLVSKLGIQRPDTREFLRKLGFKDFLKIICRS